MERENISSEDINMTVCDFLNHLSKQIEKKGRGAFVSRHEISGVVKEEYDEFGDAVRSETNDRVKYELLDIMVAAFWGAASIKSNKIE